MHCPTAVRCANVWPGARPKGARVVPTASRGLHELSHFSHDRRRTRSGTSNTSAYPEGIEAQTRQVMENLKRVLTGCGLTFDNVVSARVFLRHFDDDYERMNTVYASYFKAGRRPARTCVGVSGLARGARVEIDFIAKRSSTPPLAGEA
jgi:2-iminobutanoate/2-iminopropanoate deaminase